MKNNLQYTQETPAAQAVGAPAEELEIKAPPKKDQKKPGFWRDQWKRIKKYRKLLWFLIPAAAFTLVFSYLPMIGILFAFKGPDFNLLAPTNLGVTENLIYQTLFKSWTFQNFIDIFADETMLLAVTNTLIINVIRLVICFPLSILIAVMLSELKNQTLSKFILIIITIPNFLSWAIVIGIWSGFLHPDTGFFGVWLKSVGIDNMMALDNWFKPLVVFLSAWKGAGWGCILFYSAIMSIDKTYYESATLEGANKFQKMWYLTLPSILPTIALMLVLNISGMMSVGFEQVWTMMKANSALVDSQITLDTYIYNLTQIHPSDIPFPTALGVFNGAIALILMLVGNAITTKTLKRGLW